MEELSRKALPQEAGEERPETGFSGDRSRELLRKVWNPDTYPEGGEEENTLSLLYELWADMRSVENAYDLYALEAYYAISARLLCQSRRLGLHRELPFGTGILNPAAASVTTDWQELFGYLILLAEEIVYQKKHAGKDCVEEENVESQNAGKQTADVIEQVKSYIREHLGEDTSLQLLAQQVHFSQEYLLRLFKKKEGITILQYINALKLSAARQLLTDTKLPIKEIARQLGFSSPGYFGRFFRKKTGLTPNDWRECNGTKIRRTNPYMEQKKRIRTYSGTKDNTPTQREQINRKIARRAAAEGIVLLKNDGVLPLKKDVKTALYGGGAVSTIKGGTGSGDVNEREVVSIYQGFMDAGIRLTNQNWLEEYARIYNQAREDWRREILDAAAENPEKKFFQIYSSHVFRMPAGSAIRQEQVEGADVVFYVISRTAGESADRFLEPGDYYLTKAEKTDLTYLNANNNNLVVILNTGGAIHLEDILELSHLKGLLSISQPGMEGGHALADVLTGVVTPCGKLTDTWAKLYADIPGSGNYSHNNGNVEKEYYTEDIYVGYRYFDSFEKQPTFPFGYGLSYTNFSIETENVAASAEGDVTVKIKVTNTGDIWSGREVVQVYASCPQGKLPKEYRRLCGFGKTKLLAPAESEELQIRIPAKNLASFSEEKSAWVVEKGQYGIWVGNSSVSLEISGVLEVAEDTVIEPVKHILPLQEPLEKLSCPEEIRLEQERKWKEIAEKKGLKPVPYLPGKETAGRYPEPEAAKTAKELAAKLTEEQLISMVIGEISRGQGQTLGSAGIMVPGAAGETSGCLEEQYGVPGVVMADGPAGIRLMKSYEVDRKTGEIHNQGIFGAVEGGIFATRTDGKNTDTYYQYATAIPVGTLLAQTWDTDLLEEVGQAVAVEMEEFGISWWLAPGMNIHRNPLCGRNFEYFSEDPLLSGSMAAAITRGVQKGNGVGTTIKHFACNNQEDNRKGSDSIVSERALREIYLRGFEIAVKNAQPMAIMTSYNLINGVHAANSRDLCTVAAREEWNFQGIIMTDWTTTMPQGGSSSWGCVAAGDDLIMPGYDGDRENIRQALQDGKLSVEELRACVERMLTVIFQTNAYQDSVPYQATRR